tara:strand:- start:1026 stop:1406 length:381 start_codon:yes stop_codon:yes gene_type:complete
MNYLQEVFTGISKAIHIRNTDKTTDDSSVVHTHSKEWKDLAGFRDEMRNNCYQTRPNHKDGSFLSFFIPKEKASKHLKKFHTSKKSICTEYFSSSFIYDFLSLKSRKIANNNRKKSHHDQLSFIYR